LHTCQFIDYSLKQEARNETKLETTGVLLLSYFNPYLASLLHGHVLVVEGPLMPHLPLIAEQNALREPSQA
jgi:hypothetical protein